MPLLFSKYTRANLVAYCSFCCVYWLHLNLITNVNFAVLLKMYLEVLPMVPCDSMSWDECKMTNRPLVNNVKCQKVAAGPIFIV